MIRYSLIVVVACFLLQHSLNAQQPPDAWNEFRGYRGSGVAARVNLPPSIDAKQPTWSQQVPPGHSSPILWQDRVVLTGVNEGRLATLVYDRQTGSIVWQRDCPLVPLETVYESSSPASSTPCTDGQRLYVYFGSYGLLCYDIDGNLLWSKSLPPPQSLYGMSTSPILVGDRLILVIDSDANLADSSVSRSRLVAFDKYTGDGVMALFGAPISRSDDAERAISAALDIVARIRKLSADLQAEGLPHPPIGIGINTANVIAGNVGTPSRFNYTVLGDGVNLAARLESLTKRYQVALVVGPETDRKSVV